MIAARQGEPGRAPTKPSIRHGARPPSKHQKAITQLLSTFLLHTLLRRQINISLRRVADRVADSEVSLAAALPFGDGEAAAADAGAPAGRRDPA